MASNVFRRCACRGEDGKQLGSNCPKLVADSKHGSWGYYLAAGTNPATGKRIQYRKTGYATMREAQKARNEVASKVDKGIYVPPTKETYAVYLEAWLPRHASTGHGLKATSLDNYSRYIRNDIAPSALGRMPLTDIFAGST